MKPVRTQIQLSEDQHLPSGQGLPPLSVFLDTSGLYALLVRTEERQAWWTA